MIRRMLALALALALVLGASTVLASEIGSETNYGSTGTGVPGSIVPGTYDTMYVYTENGKSLNVRSTPYVGNNIIGYAPYRSSVQVIRFLDNGWACIAWYGGEAYVQSRFLQWYQPDPYTPVTPTATPAPTATAEPYTATDTLAVLNAEFRTAKLVTPFSVTVRPSRASGWVNMRWAPSKDVEAIAQYRSGVKLTVIAETQSWYQVVDPDTESTGFIMKAYVTRVY